MDIYIYTYIHTVGRFHSIRLIGISALKMPVSVKDLTSGGKSGSIYKAPLCTSSFLIT